MAKRKVKGTLLLILGFSLISILISLIDMGINMVGWIPVLGDIILTLGNNTLEMLQMSLAAIRVLLIVGILKIFK